MSLDEQQVGKSEDLQIKTTNPRSLLSVGAIALAAMMAATLPTSVILTDDEPVDIERRSSGQNEGGWRYDDVDPAFALDGRPFLIEPAAGPADPIDVPTCQDEASEHEACDSQTRSR